ncbi:hypothetical protein Y1Q_0011801 [Alligator mississippiensis]|uniref:Uncharacterized protein n=1 Tax=Alligator mississippiensis TaxID=8496 RepID=A0A151M164_ALLMI|nr:hypothetical protein Y1Q_0011801 [Alligator mississippiensis]
MRGCWTTYLALVFSCLTGIIGSNGDRRHRPALILVLVTFFSEQADMVAFEQLMAELESTIAALCWEECMLKQEREDLIQLLETTQKALSKAPAESRAAEEELLDLQKESAEEGIVKLTDSWTPAPTSWERDEEYAWLSTTYPELCPSDYTGATTLGCS